MMKGLTYYIRCTAALKKEASMRKQWEADIHECELKLDSTDSDLVADIEEGS